MNDIAKIREGLKLGVDALPLLFLLVELVGAIIEIYKENPEAISKADLDRLRGMVNLTQTVLMAQPLRRKKNSILNLI